jgi:Putative MetA-pathway of phenol degradation
MLSRVRVVAFTFLMGTALAAPGFAQSSDDDHLSELLPNLLRRTVTLAPPNQPGFPTHEAHFLPTERDNIYLVPNQFNGALLASLTTFPLGSSSGGFVFEGDPALGDFRPASRSFGPTFAERAMTSGRGNFNFGFTFQAARYQSFEGKDLESDGPKFYLQHIDSANPGSFPDPAYEGDLVEAQVSLDIKTDTTAFLFNYGLTDRWDVGAALPIVHVSMDAGVFARVDRAATGTVPIHVFPGANPDSSSQTTSGSATGIGDIVLRTKYRLMKASGGGLAAGLDLRVPSGNEEDLLGLGTTQAKFVLIGSTEMGRIGPHFNVSYAVAGDSSLQDVDIPNEFGYTFGVDAVAGKATLAFDIIGRTLIDAGRFGDMSRTFPLLGGGTVTRNEFARRDGNLNQVLGAVGIKFPVMEKLLITANALFSINDAGLKAKFIPVIGFEYVFPRQ